MVTITRELIEEAKRNGASEAEIKVLEDQLREQESNVVNTETTPVDTKTKDFSLDSQLADIEEPAISKEEFSIFKGDDVEDQVSKLISTKLADKNIKAESAGALHDRIKVTLANGTSMEIPLYTERNTTGALTYPVPNADKPYEDFINFINQPIDQKQADIYGKTGLKANEDGLYDIDIQQDYDVNIGEDPVMYSANADQILNITKLIEHETNKAFTSVSVDGLDIDYPGLEAQYSSFNLQNIPENTKEDVKKAIYEQVVKRFRESDESGRLNLTYDQFLKIAGGAKTGLFVNTLNKLSIRQSQQNNRKALSDIELNRSFITEENDVIFKTLNEKEKNRVIYNRDLITQIELRDKAIESGNQIEIDAAKVEIDKILKNIQSNATTYVQRGKDGLTLEAKVDERLASSFMDEDGMTEYRAKNAGKAGANAQLDASLVADGLQSNDPTLTDREALIKYYEAKTIRYQQLIKEGDNLTIKLDREKFNNITNLNLSEWQKSEYYNLIRTFTDGTFNTREHYSDDGKSIEISVNDIFNAGLDARDFTGIFDLMKGIISDKDLDLLTQYELTRDENKGERRGLYELIYLNVDPESMEQEGSIASFFRATKEAIMTEWFQQSSYESKQLFASDDISDRAVKDYVQSTLADYNAEFSGQIDPFTGIDFQPIKLTDDQIEKLTRTFMEEVGEGVGYFVPMLTEMSGLNIATGGILSYGQIGRLYQMFRTGNKFQKLTYHTFNVALEEAKMQIAFDMPVLGGTVFYLGGQATSGIKPFKDKYAFLNPLYQKVVQGGVVGAASAEVAHISEKAIKDIFLNDVDFATEFNDMYGDMDDAGKQMLINMLVFGITGFSHVKKTDFMGTSTKKDMFVRLGNENKQMLLDAMPKLSKAQQAERGIIQFENTIPADVLANPQNYLKDKQLKKYYQNIEFQKLLQKSYMIDKMHFDLSPSNPKFEVNLNKKIEKINKELREDLGESFTPIKIKLSSKREDYAHENGKDLGNIAQFDPATNTILVDKKTFKAGSEKLNHEITHAMLFAHFKNKPQAKRVFLQKVKANLDKLIKEGGLDLKTAEGTNLEKAIEGVYKENVRLEEFVTYAVEILSNKQFYSQQAAPGVFAKIKQDIMGIMTEYGVTPKIKTAQHVLDALGRFAQNPSNKKFKDLKNADMLSVGKVVENQKVEKESEFGSRDLDIKKESLKAQKDKLIAENKRLATEKPEGYKELMKENSTKLTEKGGINEQIKVNEQNIKNNEVNKKYIPEYKKLVAKKEAQLQEGGVTYEKMQQLEKLKKEFPEGSSEITRLENEIRDNKLSQRDEIALQRAGNELYKNNEKLINEFVGKSYEAGGNISKEDYMGGLREEVAKIYKSYNPASGVPFGIYLRQTLFGKNYDYTGTAKPLRYGNVLKNVKDMTLTALDKGATSFTGTEVLENMQDISGGTGRDAYIQGVNYSIGEGKLVVDLLKGQIPDAALKEVKRNITKDGVIIDGKIIKFNDLTYNNLTNLVSKVTGKNIFGKNYKQKAEYIFKNWNEITQILPKNLNTITGEAGIVETVLLDAHYKSAEQSKRIDITQGNVEGVGNVLRELRPQTKEQFLAEYKLKIDENGNLDFSGLDKKGKSPEEILEIRNILETKLPALEGQIMRSLTNQTIRQEIADRVKNGDINLGKKVGFQTLMNQIRSGKNDVLASRLEMNPDQFNKLEMDLLNYKGPIGLVTIADIMDKNNLSAADRKRLGGILGDIVTKYDAKNLTLEQVKSGLKEQRKQEVKEVDTKLMENVQTKNMDQLIDVLNKQFPELKLKKENYSELGNDWRTVGEMAKIDAMLREIFPEGAPIDALLVTQLGGGQRKVQGQRLNKDTFGEGNFTKEDLWLMRNTGDKRSGSGKEYKGEYDAFKIVDPGTFKTKMREFIEANQGNPDLNGMIYDKARELLTKKGINPKTKKPFTYEQTLEANAKLRTDYYTGMYNMIRNAPKNERSEIVQGVMRHLQLQSNIGTGISKGTFTFTGISNVLGEIIPGKSSSGFHAEHKLQRQNYDSMFLIAALKHINNPKKFAKEFEVINRDAEQVMTKYTDKQIYDSPEYGGAAGNIDYNVKEITADINYMIQRPGVASEIINLKGPRGTTLADKIIENATKKEITEALSNIKKETWTKDIYTLQFRNNNREKVQIENNETIKIANEIGINTKGKNPIEVIEAVKEYNLEVNKEIMASRLDLNAEFNNMMEGNFNIKKEATYSKSKANIISSRRKWYQGVSKEIFVGSRADDFKGLTNYRLVNQKGKKGEAQQKFYDDYLHIPYAMGVNALNVARNKTETQYKTLSKLYPNIKKTLDKDIPGSIFSNSNAIRVYLWDKAGYEIPGLAKKDIKKMKDAVTNNPELQSYADQLGSIPGKEGYVRPDAFWLTQGIKEDLASIYTREGRSHFLNEFIENANVIFSEANLNKLEVIHGKKYREALENSLYRMKTGTNRVFSKQDKLMTEYADWVNGSVGVTMFLNTRSAVLQTISATNYMDWGANNPINAAKAFANQPQYWKDFSMIWNSPMLKQRRGGLRTDVNHAELAKLSKTGGYKGVISYLLTKGFIPTQLADSFAIAAGGSTFYRNTLNRYLKEGLSMKEAEAKTWQEFTQRTQTTQQSADPSKISQIQASGLGRLIFSFQNTPMQYTREVQKSILDLNAGRGDAKHNISKILYYGAAQNILFGSLQNALFTVAFDDDDKTFDTKKGRVINGMFDTLLRGSGLPGAILSTTKNTLLRFQKENKRGWNADHAQTLIQGINIAPPVGIKVRKGYSGLSGYKINKNIIPHMGYGINNPAYSIAGNFTAAITNFPLDRLVQKSNNIRHILYEDHQWWQNAALLAGYRPYDIGIEDEEKEEAKKVVKKEKEIVKEKKQEIKKQEKEKEKIEEGEKKQKQEKKEKKQVTCLVCKLPVEKGKKYCTVHAKVEQRKDGKKTQCKFMKQITKKKTKQCGVLTANKSGYCYYHD